MKKYFSPFAVIIGAALFTSLYLSCNPNDESGLGPSNNQQIFGDWLMLELTRSGCTDANNNFRRPCNDCLSLTINTDNTFQLTNDDDELVTQGVYRLANATDITFDPGIFDSDGVSSVKYALITGSLRFTYQDQNTLCNVTESYIVKTVVGGGN